MTRRPPWDDIPDTGMVPDGAYLIQIIDVPEAATKGAEGSVLPAGCLMYRAVHWIVEPAQFTGMQLFDNFVIGTVEDPEAEDPETWKASIGARLFKQMLKKAQVPFGQDLEEMCNIAVGQQLIAVVGSQITGRGTPMNQIRSYYAVGERQVGIDAQAPAVPKAAAPKPRPAATPAAPATAGGTGPPPPTRAVPRPPPTAPAPPAPKAPAKAAAGVPMVKCTICNQQVARAEFATHVQSHTEEQE